MSRSTPAGRVCVVTAGLGIRTDLCALATLLCSVSSRPASPAPAAMPAVAAPAARKLRRRVPPGSGSAACVGSSAAGGAVTGSYETAGRAAMVRGFTSGISTSSTASADAVAARVGSRLATVAVGRVAAAVSPTTANTATPATP